MWSPRPVTASHRWCHIDSRYRIENIVGRTRGFGSCSDQVLFIERKDRGRARERGSWGKRGNLEFTLEREAREQGAGVFDASEKVPTLVYRRNEFVNEAGHRAELQFSMSDTRER